MKKERYAAGQFIIGVFIFLLVYTFFYYSKYTNVTNREGEWGISVFLSFTAVMVGMLIELGRFWGLVIEVKINKDLLVLQGIPAAILSIVPGPYWLQAGGNAFPFSFFADPVVTGISGVWLGVILLRGFFSNKQVSDSEEIKKKNSFT